MKTKAKGQIIVATTEELEKRIKKLENEIALINDYLHRERDQQQDLHDRTVGLLEKNADIVIELIGSVKKLQEAR
jgi:predicted nuclease with TOPRIM domain